MPRETQRDRRRRKAVLPGLAVLAALAAGCSAGTGADGAGSDPKPGETPVTQAAPGKYSVLPEPCSSVGSRRLKSMLPSVSSLTSEQREQLYAGTADVSYDGDRRVGCRWKAEAEDATRLLSVGYERVVAYDPATSDDDKAQEVYVRQLEAAHLTLPPPTTSATASAPTPSTTTTAKASGAPGAAGTPATSAGTASGKPPVTHQAASTGPGSPGGPGKPGAGSAAAPGKGSPSGTPSAGAGTGPGTGEDEGSGDGDEFLGSRVLEDLGDEAFLEDRLNPAGPTSQARTVRIVFRSSNVIVTLEYAVQPILPGAVPDAKQTQQRALQLASQLADELTD
ncbi:DUF3558 domain-containing protein [Streptomyces sp. NPDC093225]|uniref:DUF3558 domain-containing protein n=1 Tax=Streptomyces sp. NPDC093225 TaxID=3366034 RepID=UPI003821ADFC